MVVDILVADDDPAIREMFKDLPPKGSRVKTFEDGKQLVDYYSQNRCCALIVTDKGMPVGGLVAIQDIRRFDRDVEIWMMSGDRDVEAMRTLALSVGANRYYEKPLPVQFFEDIEDFIQDYEVKQR